MIRLANIQDCKTLFNWVNEEDSLRWKYKTNNKINYSDHKRWFSDCLENDFCKIWIIENEKGLRVGQVRINFDKLYSEIDIYISEKFRNYGFASKGMKIAIKLFSKEFSTNKFKAIIHRNNILSINFFIKNCFKKIHSDNVDWNEYILISGRRSSS